MLPFLRSPLEFPNTQHALQEPNGLLAASLHLDEHWLLNSYQRGIFPWYNPGEPVLWWSPSPRAVLLIEHFKLSRSLHNTIKKLQSLSNHRITLNHAFAQVIEACAQPRQGQQGTWITPEVQLAYYALHQQGFAHSIEHWDENKLIGGLYCVALGGMIYGESMFSRRTDASKVAFAYFVYWLKQQNVHIIDCQQSTRHLMSMGAQEMTRFEFESTMQKAQQAPALNWAPCELKWLP